MFIDEEGREFTGRSALDQLIGEEILDPGHRVTLKRPVSSIGNRHVFRWLIGSSIEEPQNQLCWLEFADDERIQRLTVHHWEQAPPSAGSQLFRWARDHPAPALAGFAGILYALLRVSMAIFYNQLGVTPEEAGFTNDELLRQSVTLLGALLLLGLVMFAFNGLVAMPMGRLVVVIRRLRLAGNQKGQWIVLLAVSTPFVISGLAMAFFFISLDATAFFISYAAFLLCLLVVPRMVLLTPPAREVRGLADEALIRAGANWPRTILPGVVGALAGVLLVSLPLIAYNSGETIKRGGTATARLLPWRALPATVRWMTKEPPVELANNCHDLRFLGESDNKVYLFDKEAQATVRVPTDDLVVSVSTDC